MLKLFKGASRFYANGTVYLTHANRAYKLRKHNFDVTSLESSSGEVWMNGGVVVAMCSGVRLRDAASDLKKVLEKIEGELSRNPKAEAK